MELDITSILDDWPYEPGQVTVRRIRGSDGRDKIQLRLDLGILQMETTGRPDGLRPHGHESELAYHESLLARHRQDTGSDEGFSINTEACELLRTEGIMYYHRYLAELVLEDFAAVERDTTRNLRMFDLCAAYAAEDSDRFVLEQYRPYVIMMRTRARGRLFQLNNRPKAALLAVRKGMQEIREFHKRLNQEASIAGSSELAVLRGLAKEIESSIPVDPVRKIRQDLDKAIKDERYEDAATLRDRLRQLEEQNPVVSSAEEELADLEDQE